MNQTLLLQLPAHFDVGEHMERRLSWVELSFTPGFGWQQNLEQGTLVDLESQVETKGFDEIVVVLSSTELYSRVLPLNKKQLKHIDKALPFLLEEEVAGDIDDLHFAISKQAAAGSHIVAAMAKARLEVLQECLAHHGINASVMTSDALLLPVSSNQWTLLLEEQQGLLRVENGAVYTFDARQIDTVMPIAVGEAEEKLFSIRCISKVGSEYNSEFLSKEASSSGSDEAEATFSLKFDTYSDSALSVLADEYVNRKKDKNLLNILQGKYKAAVVKKKLGINFKPLSVLVAACLVLHLSFLITKGYYYDTAYKHARSDSIALYKSYFPNERVKHLRKQFESKVQGDSGQVAESNQFSRLLLSLGKSLYNLAQGQEVLTLKRISFDERQGELKVDLFAKSYNQIEKLKENLEVSSLNVSIASAVAENEGYKGHIKIRVK